MEPLHGRLGFVKSVAKPTAEVVFYVSWKSSGGIDDNRCRVARFRDTVDGQHRWPRTKDEMRIASLFLSYLLALALVFEFAASLLQVSARPEPS